MLGIHATLAWKDKSLAIRVPDRDHIGNIVRETSRFYEEDLLSALHDAVPPGSLVVDVGANIGNHTLFFSNIMNCRVVAFEPLAEALDYLRTNVSLNGLRDLVEIRSVGLSSDIGHASSTLQIAFNLGSSRLTQHDDGDLILSTLDNETFTDPVAMLKIDAEGMEVAILEGARRFLEANRPLIVVEAANATEFDTVANLLKRHDYTPISVFAATDTYLFSPSRTAEELERLARLAATMTLRAQMTARAQERRHLQLARDMESRLQETARKLSAIERDAREIRRQHDRLRKVLAGPLFRALFFSVSTLRRIKSAAATRLSRLTAKSPLSSRPTSRMERHWRRPVSPSTAVSSNPLVTVIVTTFNSQSHIDAALQSLLQQSHSNLDILVVDDASSDATQDKIENIAAQDPRVRLIRNPRNLGTYWAKNSAMLEARGELITFMDSDDTSDERRIEKQIEAIRVNGSVASICNCIRVDPDGNVVLNRGLRERTALISLMIKRDVVREIGYFDTVRTSADDEYLERIKLVYGAKTLKRVEEPLYIAAARANSLTTTTETSVSLSGDEADFLSKPRRRYVEEYSAWHAKVKAAGRRPYVPFPVTLRPFPVDDAIKVANGTFDRQPIHAFMATYPPRLKHLERAVGSLLGQVDHLFIYLNGYTSVPRFLRSPRITALAAGTLEDLRDVGKFFHMSTAPDGYFLTVDDDIEYPHDYAERMVQEIERHCRDAIVGVHGMIFANPLDRFFSERRRVFSFKDELASNVRVNALGTGTVGFHSSLLSMTPDFRSAKGMADLWLAIKAKKNSIPMYAIPRPRQWLKPIVLKGEGGTSLYDEFHFNDVVQTNLLREAGDWSLDRPSEHTRVRENMAQHSSAVG
ncbi:FkbM family methyltransferase [Hyphomicrobium sp.]|uniref:FkbM family methyltransferase n=1 Tax=Hyphomicrobium sp. TaxID=82 RepID=UPI002E32120A|nr:FkbM family methyltransferase [Hyphomicrobium sp.]HEX2841173.1 FkbM family methyltransferase [Hyphomicrobium sp.]